MKALKQTRAQWQWTLETYTGWTAITDAVPPHYVPVLLCQPLIGDDDTQVRACSYAIGALDIHNVWKVQDNMKGFTHWHPLPLPIDSETIFETEHHIDYGTDAMLDSSQLSFRLLPPTFKITKDN